MTTVRLTANGQILATPKDGDYRGVFTPSTESLPRNEANLDVAGSKPDASDGPGGRRQETAQGLKGP